MTTPPLPASPCVRVRLGYTASAGTEMGSRFYLSYASSAPTAANCLTLATDIAAAWASHLAAVCYELVSLTEVDVLDIATDSGAHGTYNPSTAGSMSGGTLTANAAINVEFDIARRYRGGKPRMFLPPPDDSSLTSIDKYSSTFVGTVNTAFAAFMSEITALSIGSMGALAHINLSYYQGFKNITNSSGRERAAPTYRNTALVDQVTGYSTKAVIGSQRRRRTATTI